MLKNFKLLIAITYIICLSILLYAIFSYFDLRELTSYTFIKDNSSALIDFKNNNLILSIVGFLVFSFLWVLFLGFGSLIAILSGYIFGVWAGTIISVVSMAAGSTALYFLARMYFAEFIIEKLSKKIEKYQKFFNKNEFLYFMLFRFTGGAGIPFAIQNILPVIFNMKLKNYFYASLLGLIPSIFIINSLGSGIEKLIENNTNIDLQSIISDRGIYLPLIGFFTILVVSYFIKKKVFKN